jgi:glyoxylase-like metal-dependent hydrolase (beta-lactamase superfamily II)
MRRGRLRALPVVALTCALFAAAAAFAQDQTQPGRAAGGRGGRGAALGGRGGEELVPTALLSERNLKPADFPTLRSTTGDVYVWEDAHTLGFLTNNLIVITSGGVLVADGQNSPEATRKMVEAIGLLTPQPIKYVVVCSEHGDHTGGNEAFPASATFISSPASQASLARQAKTPTSNGRKTIVPTQTVADRRILKMGNTEIHILNNGRSHTGGDLEVYLPREKVLFTSESFSSRIFPSMANAYPSEWIQTVKRLREIDATFVVPGHGFLDPVPNMTREMVEFEKALEYVVGEVTRIHATGASVEEGLKQVNWGPYATWSIAERNGPNAFRRIYDELEGKLKN